VFRTQNTALHSETYFTCHISALYAKSNYMTDSKARCLGFNGKMEVNVLILGDQAVVQYPGHVGANASWRIEKWRLLIMDISNS